MKKLLGIFAVTAFLFGAVSCSNDDATITDINSTVDTMKAAATFEVGGAKSLTTEIGQYSAKEFKVSTNIANEIKDSAGKVTGYEFESSDFVYVDDDTVVRVTPSAKDTVKIEGLAEGSTAIYFNYQNLAFAEINVTVTEFVGVLFNNLSVSSSETPLKAMNADETNFASVADLEYIVKDCFGTVNTESTKVNSSVINGAPGYKITSNTDRAEITAGDELGVFTTVVEAAKDITLDKIVYTIGSSSFAVKGKVQVFITDDEGNVEEDAEADYESADFSESSKGATGTDTVDVALAEGKKALIVVHVYADNNKTGTSSINFGIGDLKISAK